MCDDMGMLSIANDDMDVYDDGNPCTVDACSAGAPSNMPAMAGTMCGPMGGAPKVCDMGAACVQCAADMDCMANPGAKCSQGKCVPATCINMAKDGTETDVDCGGGVPPCKDMRSKVQETACEHLQWQSAQVAPTCL
jgi:hypothetical protein